MRFWRLCTLVAALLPAACSRSKIHQQTLCDAAAAGDTRAIASLLARGAPVNQKDSRGLTPLILATRAGAVPAVEMLLGHGADPDLRGGVNDWTPLMHAVHKGQRPAAKTLLAGHADVNARMKHGMTALMMAAGYGDTPMVELLLDYGANPRALTADGENALSIALTGVPDIDRFTLASCQAGTVLELKRRYPDLRLPDNLWARVAQFAGGVARLRLAGRYGAAVVDPEQIGTTEDRGIDTSFAV